jgi:alkaline phosphatase
MKTLSKCLLTTLLAVSLISCSNLPIEQTQTTQKAKNIILMIGDGMGPPQIGLLLSYARQAPHGILTTHKTAVDRIMDDGRLGLSMVHPDSALVVDSAASAT